MFNSQEQIIKFLTDSYERILKPEFLHKSYYEEMIFYLTEGDYVSSEARYVPYTVSEVVFNNVRIVGYSFLTNQQLTLPSGNYTANLLKIALEMYNPGRVDINNGRNIYYVLGFYFISSSDVLVSATILPFSNTQQYYPDISSILVRYPDFRSNGRIILFNQLSIGI